jgi:hypothetical protein
MGRPNYKPDRVRRKAYRTGPRGTLSATGTPSLVEKIQNSFLKTPPPRNK